MDGKGTCPKPPRGAHPLFRPQTTQVLERVEKLDLDPVPRSPRRVQRKYRYNSENTDGLPPVHAKNPKGKRPKTSPATKWTPRPYTRRQTRTRAGHRSISSRLNSRSQDTGVDGCGTGDSAEVPPPTQAWSPWQAFEDHVREVAAMSLLMSFTPRHNLRFRASESFSKVMDQVAPKVPDTKTGQTARTPLSDSSDVESEPDIVPEKQAHSAVGLRCWAILRRHVKEMIMKRRNQKNQGWNFLRHTIKQMTDMERAREELYEKYLHNPDQWIAGLINAPEYLLRRLARAEATKATRALEEEAARLEEEARKEKERVEAKKAARKEARVCKSAVIHRERWR